jgi:hypothetical protein
MVQIEDKASATPYKQEGTSNAKDDGRRATISALETQAGDSDRAMNEGKGCASGCMKHSNPLLDHPLLSRGALVVTWTAGLVIAYTMGVFAVTFGFGPLILLLLVTTMAVSSGFLLSYFLARQVGGIAEDEPTIDLNEKEAGYDLQQDAGVLV